MPRAKKKLHWTQTPEGRKRAIRLLKKAAKARQRKAKETKRHVSKKPRAPETPGNATLDHHVAYAFGRTQGWIHAYAEAIGLAGGDLADRVGQLLVRGGQGG